MTREVFAQSLSVLAAPFRVQLDELTAEAYWLVLKDCEPNELQSAVARALAECEFMPPPAKLRAFVRERRTDVSRGLEAERLHQLAAKYTDAPKQLEAWRETVKKLTELKS